MLAELFSYLTTPCPLAHRRLGYLSGLIAIQARYQRVGEHWRDHLSHTQELILQSTQQCSQHNSVVVLGSGLLLDVPLEQLSQRFKKVMLVDAVQLRSVRHRCQKLANVTLLEHDVTGLARSLLAYRRHDPLPTLNANLPDATQNSDLIISCNLLSQLAHPTNSGSGPLPH